MPSLEKNGLCIVEKNDICEKGNMLNDGQCILNTGNFRVDDPSFTRQNLQTVETMSNPQVAIIIESLGAVLIMSFIIIFAIKKRRQILDRGTVVRQYQ